MHSQGAQLLPDGGLQLPACLADELRACIVCIEDALLAFDGRNVCPADARTKEYERADNRRDLELIRTLLGIVGRSGIEGEPLELYANEARLFRQAKHDLFVATIVYDGALLEDGTSMDLSRAVRAVERFGEIIGRWERAATRDGG